MKDSNVENHQRLGTPLRKCRNRLLSAFAVLIALACFARLSHQTGIGTPIAPTRKDDTVADQANVPQNSRSEKDRSPTQKVDPAMRTGNVEAGAVLEVNKQQSVAPDTEEKTSPARPLHSEFAGLVPHQAHDPKVSKHATKRKHRGGRIAEAVHEKEIQLSPSLATAPKAATSRQIGGVTNKKGDNVIGEKKPVGNQADEDAKVTAEIRLLRTEPSEPDASSSSSEGFGESDASSMTYDDSWLKWMYGDAEEEHLNETSTADEFVNDMHENSDQVKEGSDSGQEPSSATLGATSQDITGDLQNALQNESDVANAARDATESAIRGSAQIDEDGEEEPKTVEREIGSPLPDWRTPALSQTADRGVSGANKSSGARDSSARAGIKESGQGEGKGDADARQREEPTGHDSASRVRLVPASMSMARAWWAVSENEATSSTFLIDASSTSLVFRNQTFPLEAGSVSENHDVRNFGTVRSANVVAYRHQMACGEFQTTLHLINEMPSMYSVVCTLAHLSALAEEAAAGLHVPVQSAAVRALAKVSRLANARKHAIEVALAMRKHVADAASRQDSVNLGLLLNSVMMEQPHLRPVGTALMMMLMECRASLPYFLREQNGYPVTRPETVPQPPHLRHMDATDARIRIPVDAPTVFPITIVPPSGAGAHASTENEPWRQPMYKVFSRLWFFVMHAYRIGERFDDVYKTKHVDKIFPSPWRVTYVGVALWTEWFPFHDANNRISPGGQEALEKYKLRTVLKRVPYSLKKQLYVEETPETPARVKGVLRPFTVDKCDRDSTYASTEASPFVVLLEKRPDAAGTGEQKKAGDEQTLKMHDADAVWVIKGTDGVKPWVVNALLQVVKDPTFSEEGLVHQGFSSFFHHGLRRPLTRFASKVAKAARERTREDPYSVVVTGHSLGGALTLLSVWFLARTLKPYVDAGVVVIYGVVYGSPTIGDAVALQELNSCGAKIFRVRIDLDPVPMMGQTAGVTKLYKDDKDDIVLRTNDLANVTLWNPDGSLLYSGLVWLLDAVQPFRRRKKLLRLFARHFALPQFVHTYNNPMYTHLHLLPCIFTILTGMYEEYAWSSYCAAPLLRRYPLFPSVLSAELEEEMKRVHEQELPGVLKRLESRLKNESWARKTQKLFQAGLGFFSRKIQ
ncbi:lipase [Toxoplasma gondii RUB]|uniref:Lipase n=1 Tax=Toxoplasma gondii RUB TaxID=935652 RepID=A0A086LXY4_TOXGO|nr:lipase [Toxoplasma gondii RUB]